MRAAVIQMVSTADLNRNLEQAERLRLHLAVRFDGIPAHGLAEPRSFFGHGVVA